MRNIRTFIIISIFAVGFANAQNKSNNVEYDELLKLKVDENRYTFGWYDNVFSGIPCFRDYTENDIQTELVDKKTDSVFYKSTEPKRNGLIIIPDRIYIDREKNRFQISGKITGGYVHAIPDEFKIYIGKRNDTISNITLSPSLHGDVYFNGEKVDSTIVLQTIPAFHLKHLTKFEAYRGNENVEGTKYKEMLFDIDAIIDENSILVFGLSTTLYAEIFEIGKLLSE